MAGATINILRIPERWVQPKRKQRTAAIFDYWLNSHQLMHILVGIAMMNLHLGACLDYEYWAGQPSCLSESVS